MDPMYFQRRIWLCRRGLETPEASSLAMTRPRRWDNTISPIELESARARTTLAADSSVSLNSERQTTLETLVVAEPVSVGLVVTTEEVVRGLLESSKTWSRCFTGRKDAEHVWNETIGFRLEFPEFQGCSGAAFYSLEVANFGEEVVEFLKSADECQYKYKSDWGKALGSDFVPYGSHGYDYGSLCCSTTTFSKIGTASPRTKTHPCKSSVPRRRYADGKISKHGLKRALHQIGLHSSTPSATAC